MKSLFKAYNGIVSSKDKKVKNGSLFTSQILEIGKTVEKYQVVVTLESFFKNEDWKTFSEQHLAEAVRKEAVKPATKGNSCLDESMSVDYEDALNSAEFADVNNIGFSEFRKEFDVNASDDDPWKQFNDFSPEEVVIESLAGFEADDNPNDQAFRLSCQPENKPDDMEIELEDPFDNKVVETDFKTEVLGKDPEPIQGALGHNPYTIHEEPEQLKLDQIEQPQAKEDPPSKSEVKEAETPIGALLDTEFTEAPENL